MPRPKRRGSHRQGFSGNRRGGQSWRAPAQEGVKIELVPVTEGLVECPVCHGGVKVITAQWSDPEVGIVVHKTKLYGSHGRGGKNTSHNSLDKCSASQTQVKQ